MGTTKLVRDPGAIAANAASGVTLRSFPHLPDYAVIETVVVRNNSLATISMQNLPGKPSVDPGERTEFEVRQQDIVLVPDAAVNSGELQLHLVVKW